MYVSSCHIIYKLKRLSRVFLFYYWFLSQGSIQIGGHFLRFGMGKMRSVWRCGCLGYSSSLAAPQVLWISTLLCSLIVCVLEHLTTALKEKTQAVSLGQSISALFKEMRKESRYLGVFATKTGGQNIKKRLLLIKENQVSQVKEFRAFLCPGSCKNLGSLKSFIWCASQLSGASILYFLILSLLRVHCSWRLQQLTARWAWKWAACLSPYLVPSGLFGSVRSAEYDGLMAATFFVYWEGRQTHRNLGVHSFCFEI